MTETKDYFKHHAYVGLGLIAVSLFLHGFWHYFVLLGGWWLLTDDIGQEIMKMFDPEFRSPINILFRYLWGLTGWDWPFKY